MTRLLLKLLIIIVLLITVDRVSAQLIAARMVKYYGLEKAAPVLLVGNSHTRDGIDEVLLAETINQPVVKYAFGGSTVFDRLAMLKHYADMHPGAMRYVIYNVDEHLFTWDAGASKSYTNLYPFMQNREIRSYLRQSAASWNEYSLRQFLWMLRFTPDMRNMAITQNRGTYRDTSISISELKKEIAKKKGSDYRSISFDSQNIRCLEETMSFVRSQGAVLVFVYIPDIDLWSGVVDQTKQFKAIGMFEDYAVKSHGGVRFLSYKEKIEHRHDLYYDRAHLNINGKALLTVNIADGLLKLKGVK